MEAQMVYSIRRIAFERFLHRRARQRSAAVARGKITSITTARPADAPKIAVPAALLKFDDVAVRRLLAAGRRRGYVTFDELNGVLPDSDISSEEIEAAFEALSGLGIEVREF
jgi:hypothetical protein